MKTDPSARPTKAPAPPAKPKISRSKASYRRHSGLEKTQAVLSVWSERRKPRHVCRELSITWQQLSAWQDKALTAMVAALEPPVSDQPKPPALSERLRKLLAKRAGKLPAKGPATPGESSANLAQRLANLSTEMAKPKDA